MVAECGSWIRNFKRAEIKDFGHFFESWLCHSAAKYRRIDLSSVIASYLKWCHIRFLVPLHTTTSQTKDSMNGQDLERQRWWALGTEAEEQAKVQGVFGKWWVIYGGGKIWKGENRFSIGVELKWRNLSWGENWIDWFSEEGVCYHMDTKGAHYLTRIFKDTGRFSALQNGDCRLGAART